MLSSKQNRMDGIQDQLTPKDWAMWLADEIRRYPSFFDFFSAVAQGTFQQAAPFLPFFRLRRQASLRHRDWIKEGANGERKLSRKLRTEFLALKTLIFEINQTIVLKVAHSGLRTAQAELDALLQRYAFGLTASRASRWIIRDGTPDGEEGEQRLKMLEELGEYAQVIFLERPSESPSSESPYCFASLVEGWGNGFSALMFDVFGHQAAVQVTEKRYFDGHPILARDIEEELANAIEVMRALAARFNGFVMASNKLLRLEEGGGGRESGEGSADGTVSEVDVAIDVQSVEDQARSTLAEDLAQKWERDASSDALGEILAGTAEFIPHFWHHVQQVAERGVITNIPEDAHESAAPEVPTG